MPKIRVLIVDDAVVVRQIVTNLLAADPEIEVVGTAANGRIALAKITQLNPDIVTMDVEMPEMDGLQTLRELRKIAPKLPVIMFSTLTERGAASTIDALSAGASDYVTKPSNVGRVGDAMMRVRDELIPKIKALAAPTKALWRAPAAAPGAVKTITPRAAVDGAAGRIEALAIGVSTGGPNALSEVLPRLPANLGIPVFVVQHMPPMFTKFLADRLGAQSALKVCEAAASQRVAANNVYIAPGDYHMTVERRADGLFIATNQGLPENSCRPSVDVLFRSVAKALGSKVLGLIMTGMGSDGLHGCQTIHEAGGRVIAQDEATSVVWGMPGFVANAGLAEKLLPLDRIAAEIVQMINGTGSLVRAAG
jgi:two-component system, chemotaxis family, protein-glutamate methylesterase/glutaminase